MSYTFRFRGFQSIRNPIELLVDGYCVVEGESNLGKTALVRAILAMVSNQAGTDFITEGMNTFEGWIQHRGHVLKWIKDRKSTTYEIDGKLISRPGRGTIPEEVRLIGIAPIRTLDKQLHWPQVHLQWESPFVIGSYTDTIAAELLGASEETAKVSRAIKLVNTDVSKNKTKAELLEGQNKTLLDNIGAMEVLAKQLNAHQQDVDRLESGLGALQAHVQLYRGLIHKYRVSLTRWKTITPLIKASIPSPPDCSRYTQLRSLNERYQKARDLIRLAATSRKIVPEVPAGRDRVERLVGLQRDFQRVSGKLDIMVRVAVERPVDRPEIQRTVDRYQGLKDLRDRFLKAQRDVASSSRVLDEISQALDGNSKERKRLDYVVGTMETCPLCEAPMRDGKFCYEEVV